MTDANARPLTAPRATPRSIALTDADLSDPMTNRERVLMLAVYRHCEVAEGFDPGESMWGMNPTELFVLTMAKIRNTRLVQP